MAKGQRGQRVSREHARHNAERRHRDRSGSGPTSGPHKRVRDVSQDNVDSDEARYSRWYPKGEQAPDLRPGERYKIVRKTLDDGKEAVGLVIRKAMTEKQRELHLQRRRMEILSKNVFFHADGEEKCRAAGFMPIKKSPFWRKTKQPDELENTCAREPTEIECHIVDDIDSGPADSGSDRKSDLDQEDLSPGSPDPSVNGDIAMEVPDLEEAMAHVQNDPNLDIPESNGNEFSFNRHDVPCPDSVANVDARSSSCGDDSSGDERSDRNDDGDSSDSGCREPQLLGYPSDPMPWAVYDEPEMNTFVRRFLRGYTRGRMERIQGKEMWSIFREYSRFDPRKLKSFDTMMRRVRRSIPKPKVYWQVKDRCSGRVIRGKGYSFPEKKFKDKWRYQTLVVWTRVPLMDVIRFHAASHPNAPFMENGRIRYNKVHITFTYDGIPNGKSSPDTLNVMGLTFRGCRQVYIPQVRVARRFHPKDIHEFLDSFVNECKHLHVKVDFFVADAPMRAFLKCLKGHAGRYSCEICEAEGTCEHRRICYPSEHIGKERRTQARWLHHVSDLHEQRRHGHVDNVKGITDRSPLIDLPGFDMIKNAPSDPMHRDWLGIAKAILWKHTLALGKNGVISSKGKRIADRISAEYMRLRLPTEFQHKSRQLDYANFKSHEWKSITVSCFPVICQVVHDEYGEGAAQVWLLFVYLILVYNGPSHVRDCIGRRNLETLHKNLYELFEDEYGKGACTFNWHNFSHMPEIIERATTPQMSTESFESAYGRVQKSYVSGTRNIGKQITINMILRGIMHREGPKCGNHLAMEPFKDLRRNDSIIIDDNLDYYEVKATSEDNVCVARINTEKWCCPQDPTIPMHLVGVFKYVGVDESTTLVPRDNFCGKGLLTPNGVLIPLYKDLLFS